MACMEYLDTHLMQVTGFSNTEEEAIKRAALVPFLLEDRIREVRNSTVTQLKPLPPKYLSD